MQLDICTVNMSGEEEGRIRLVISIRMTDKKGGKRKYTGIRRIGVRRQDSHV